MSSVTTQNEIEYPESDGKPMGETDLHRDWMFRLLEIFRQRYRDEQVYIASDLLVYYEEGTPSKFVVPDCFVVLDCKPGRRRTFQTWNEKRVPNVVFEVTSRGTSSIDIVDKPVIYERMGVQEYFLYDPTASYLEPPLQGYRMANGSLHQIAEANGRIRCETLGVELFLREDNLVIVDKETGVEQLTRADAEELAREQAERMQEQELEARLIAERRVQELEEKLRRLESGN
ncbi:MAG: Uma2 family endonuclease [Planctomycetales bacterium]|jgi:Uma2 family endonuclease|nr:Uma2 family endonuclease [Planctomycetales bacterium]